MAAEMQIWQQAPPPADESVDAGYNYWPVTDAATMQDFTTSTWGGDKWAFLWSNRYNYGDAWNKRPNYLPAPLIYIDDKQCRSVFTTLEKANAATRTQVRHMIGMDNATAAAPWIAAGGVLGDLVTEAAWRASPGTYCTADFVWSGVTYRVMSDKVLLPTPRFVDGPLPALQKGVVLDYEVGDSRTTAVTLQFIQDVAADLHAAGRELFFYSNPLTAPTAPYHGVSPANLPGILDACDYVGMMLWSEAPEGNIPDAYAAQVATLGTITPAEWAKLVIVFELGDPGTSYNDALWTYEKLHEAGTTHPSRVMFWRNYAVAGSPAANEKIALVCFGGPPP